MGAGLTLLGQLEVLEVDLVLEVLNVALLLVDVFAHGGQAHLVLALDFLGLVFLLRFHLFLCTRLVLVTLSQLLSIE